jgi:hypothetical protein
MNSERTFNYSRVSFSFLTRTPLHSLEALAISSVISSMVSLNSIIYHICVSRTKLIQLRTFFLLMLRISIVQTSHVFILKPAIFFHVSFLFASMICLLIRITSYRHSASLSPLTVPLLSKRSLVRKLLAKISSFVLESQLILIFSSSYSINNCEVIAWGNGASGLLSSGLSPLLN